MLLATGSELLGAAGGRLVFPGGVPGGHFCESCIFERSYSLSFTYQIRYVLAGTGSSRLTPCTDPCTKFSDQTPNMYCLFVCYEGTVHQNFAIMIQRIVFLHNFGPVYHESVLRTSLGLVILAIDLITS